MSMDFTIPDMEEVIRQPEKGRMKKPRRAGSLRLGDPLRALETKYDARLVSEDEDRKMSFYSMEGGSVELYGAAAQLIGAGVRKKKVCALYLELSHKERVILIERMTEREGEPVKSGALLIWADTATSLFLDKEDGNGMSSLALMDTGAAKVLEDHARARQEQEQAQKGFLGRLWSAYIDPVGRVGQRAYIVRILTAGIPAAFLFAFSWLYPERFVGDTNPFIVIFLVAGSILAVAMISLAIRRLSDIGWSHLYYWGFFALLFAINQLGGQFLGSDLMATRLVGLLFMAACVLLAFFPGEPRKNKYGPVPKRGS